MNQSQRVCLLEGFQPSAPDSLNSSIKKRAKRGDFRWKIVDCRFKISDFGMRNADLKRTKEGDGASRGSLSVYEADC